MDSAEKYKKKCGERMCKEWLMRASVDNCFKRMKLIADGREKLLKRDMTALFILSTVISVIGVIVSYMRCRSR